MSARSIQLTDFSDRFSPMLVKELRQGLRARTFIALFLGLQIFLAVMLLSASAASTSDQVGNTISGILFMFFGVAVLLVQPLRGIGALASEVKGNTIDMMVLTRLSAWRIVFGKWIALVSQSALLLFTIIPYLILRYFLGGMNLVGELVFLLLMFLTSMGLTAVTVGLSGCSAILIRSLLPIIGLPVMMWSFMMMMFSPFMRGSGIMDVCSLSTAESRIGVAIYCAAILYLGGSMLSLGASLIAPAAENHALIRRIVAFVLLFATLLVGLFTGIESWLVIALVSILAIPALVIALSESAPFVPTVLAPFKRFGAPGRVLGSLFLPTWASGIFAAIMISMLAMAAIFLHGAASSSGPMFDSMDDEGLLVILAFLGALLFPAVWQVFLFKGEGQRLAHYLPLLVGSLVMWGVLSAFASAMNSSAFLWLFAWHPLTFLAMLVNRSDDTALLTTCVILLNAAFFAILLFRALPELRQTAADPIDENPLPPADQ